MKKTMDNPDDEIPPEVMNAFKEIEEAQDAIIKNMKIVNAHADKLIKWMEDEAGLEHTRTLKIKTQIIKGGKIK